jgi:nucleotide-binding universal stress UspA family protein
VREATGLKKAIAWARERSDKLVFLFAADTSFRNQTAAPLVVNVGSRLEWMGRFQLAMAKELAASQGVTAQIVVRQGKLRIEPVATAEEMDATLILLGRPVGQDVVFGEAALQAFAALWQSETGIEVFVV